ncbi:hypothetical protein [Streptosporangium sp. NPDC049078]|uniref:hypothetical protein n=1 Tax=Streptosporangium sp. NPDC049078 TaxID=3155767 RepID=UPI00341A7C43
MASRSTARRPSRRKPKKSEWGTLIGLVFVVWAAALAIGRLSQLPAWAVLGAGFAIGVVVTLSARRMLIRLGHRFGVQVTRTKARS